MVMDAQTKRTVRFALIFGFFLGGLFGWTLNEMFNDADAELEWIPTQEGIITYAPSERSLLEDILVEEKKQTKLLDHIDCIQTTKYFHKFVFTEFKDYPSSCGQRPLNITGVWNP